MYKSHNGRDDLIHTGQTFTILLAPLVTIIKLVVDCNQQSEGSGTFHIVVSINFSTQCVHLPFPDWCQQGTHFSSCTPLPWEGHASTLLEQCWKKNPNKTSRYYKNWQVLWKHKPLLT